MQMHRVAPGQAYDAIVIGGGVNGLVCANLLAQSGRRIAIAEAHDRLGGLCTSYDICPGHRVSTVAHLVGPLDPLVMKSLKLQKFGLQFSAKEISTVILAEDGRHIFLGDDMRATAQSLVAHSASDSKNWAKFESRLRRIAQQLKRWVQDAPASEVESSTRGSFFSSRVPKLAAISFEPEVAVALDGSLDQLLSGTFESAALKGGVAFDAILGNALGPASNGTAFLAVLQRAIHTESADGWAHPQGGSGALTAALTKSAEALQVAVKLNARVAQLLFEQDKVAGVELANGDTLFAPVVVSTLDPKSTLIGLGCERFIPFGLKRHLCMLNDRASVAKVNLALSHLPNFKGLDKRHLRDRLVICPSLDYLERGFAAFEGGQFSSDLAMEITIPSTHDASLASGGHHVLSANVIYVPKVLRYGTWDAAKADLVGRVAAVLRRYAPELPDSVTAADAFSPADLAEMSGSGTGHWHGIDVRLDQIGPLRPADGFARFSTPISGLFLGGAGTHPCGGITGTNGRLAAEAVLAKVTSA